MKIFVKFAFFTILCLTRRAELKSLEGNIDQNASIYSGFIESKTINWCDLNCEKEEHIACTWGGKCHTPKSPCQFLKVNPEKLLEAHNNLRSEFATGKNQVAPNVKASNMLALSWDNDLTFLAQCNMMSCPPKMTHDHCHTTEKFSTAGQNLAWSRGVKDCIKFSYTAVQGWYDEYKLLTEEQINSTTSNFQSIPKVGHFTQLVWAESQYIGCAITIKGEAEKTECMVACNYGPAGNVLSLGMYKQGPPASECPEGLQENTKFEGLCGDVVIPPSDSAVGSNKVDTTLFLFFLVPIIYM